MAADSDGEPEVGFTPPFVTNYNGNGETTACSRLGVYQQQLCEPSSGTHYSSGDSDEDNDLIQTVFTCHGNVGDPDFPERLAALLERLSTLLATGKDVLMRRVKKIEPWNSVRVTLTIPRDAATRLRALAAAGDAALHALGILSVQVDGDQVISLRLAGRLGGEPQEIVLRTNSQDSTSASGNGTVSVSSSSSSSTSFGSDPITTASTSSVMGPPSASVTALLNAVAASSSSSSPATSSQSLFIPSAVPTSSPSSAVSSGFRSPNVVAPAASSVIPPPPAPKVHAGPSPYPFASMTHAAQAHHARESVHHNFTPPQPPPPYSSKPFATPSRNSASKPSVSNKVVTAHHHPSSSPVPPPPDAVASTPSPTVSLSSPLLVNLLQTDGKELESSSSTTVPSTPIANANMPPRPPNHHHHHLHHMSRSQRPSKVAVAGAVSGAAATSVAPTNVAGMPARGVTPRHFRRFVPTPSASAPITPSSFLRTSQSPSKSNHAIAVKDHQGVPSQPPPPPQRSVIHGYSQFTALSSKPCTTNEVSEKSEEKKTTDGKKLIVNPLTGELEPMPSESSESEEESAKDDPFLYSPSPSGKVFSDDEALQSRKSLVDGSDASDSEGSRTIVNCIANPHENNNNSRRQRQNEKIKLRFMVDKSSTSLASSSSEQQPPTTQTPTSAYKVDVSFVNAPPTPALGTTGLASASGNSTSRKPLTGSTKSGIAINSSGSVTTSSSSGAIGSSISSTNTLLSSPSGDQGSGSSLQPLGSEEPRVPPLHISLRGRNATVVSSSLSSASSSSSSASSTGSTGKKKSPHWPPPADDELYTKFKKKVKDGRDCIAIGNCEGLATTAATAAPSSPPKDIPYGPSKAKRFKMRRLAATAATSASGASPPYLPTSPPPPSGTISNPAPDGPIETSNSIKLKLPVSLGSPPLTDLTDERLTKKRKDSKRVRNNLRHTDDQPDPSVSSNPTIKSALKMDSEEWISRTLKEESLRQSSGSLDDDVKHSAGESVVMVNDSSGDASETGHQHIDTAQGDTTETCTDVTNECQKSPEQPVDRTTANFELGDLLLLRKNSIESTLKPDGIKLLGTNLLELSEQLQIQHDEVEAAAVRKPQEIGGKIKSELSSKIDRVSGKLKNDLSKDGSVKKKIDETTGKGQKAAGRIKGKGDGVEDVTAFGRNKRRYSGDQSTSESQAQRIKRSSSSDQVVAGSPTKPIINRKMRKDSVIDRLRKDKLSKVLAVTNNKVSDINISKKIHVNRVQVVNTSPSKSGQCSTTVPQATQQSATLTSDTGKSCSEVVTNAKEAISSATATVDTVVDTTSSDKQKSLDAGSGGGGSGPNGSGGGSGNGEGNTQGEDSGIESMDALSEKSPNQGESPCRKDEPPSAKDLADDTKKGQNHDRLEDEDRTKEGDSNSCLRTVNETSSNSSSRESAQAPTVPCDESIPDLSKTKSSSDPVVEESPKSTTIPQQEPSSNQPPPLKTPTPPPPETSSTNTVIASATTSSDLVGSFETKIREAFQRDDDITREGLAAKILEGNPHHKDWTTTGKEQQDDVENGKNSPSLEDMERFRVKPPLYTYAKREESLSPSPTTQRNHHGKQGDEDEDDLELDTPEEAKTPRTSKEEVSSTNATAGASPAASGRCLRGSNKSLLEQLLIEIPEDTRRTRSWHKLSGSPGGTPKSSPRPSSPNVARSSPRCKLSPTSRSNPNSNTNSTTTSTNTLTTATTTSAKRPNKRKCSENAAELIKACIDDGKTHATRHHQHHNQSGASVNTNSSASSWKKSEVESSDDEPLSDLARSREHSVEQEVKGSLLIKTKSRSALDDEISSRNNNKIVMMKSSSVGGADTPTTRRSVRQTAQSAKAAAAAGSCAAAAVAAAGGGSTAPTTTASSEPIRSVRSTRSAVSLESTLDTTSSKRRRISRDSK